MRAIILSPLQALRIHFSIIDMPYLTEWKDKGYYIKYSGRVSTDDVIQASVDIQGDPRFDNLRYIISDYLDIDILEYDADNFKEKISYHAFINAAASRSNPQIKRAVVATDKTVLSFADIYKNKSSEVDTPWEFSTFSSVDEAYKWVLN
jgi:hypothetical protein